MSRTITVVAGNPKPASRTLAAARLVAEQFADDPAEIGEVDVIKLGVGLLGWGDEAVARAVSTVRSSDIVVIASPTYKATYTGVLKLFLDQFDAANGLAGVTAIPLMLGAGPAHFMAPEVHLKPLLVELGATVPCAGLYLGDKTFDEPGAFDAWLGQWRASVEATADALLATRR
ncbi:FMN reductase [Pseudoclavibacter endophyticus]|uniref:NADPH-dependent oxidoreductase n=1 Tax=Pseudoclavibacter endophyticus TaxID=1778590 RepID=A0A6H9WTA5_9MICO|nr:NAD(P)H-dependent oxidoreductase [Pseudoclavibacter endophyticus]KAB1649490.1 NADPH-dependent oxidoreductase [Pseudoclavibacter endophyticus]GGA62229.1 FMN reductase [Pseudoclavibacter endophyticus]